MAHMAESSRLFSRSLPAPPHPRNTRCPMTRQKRIFDIVISAATVTAFAPVFALIAIAIRIEDGGPALFRQPRIGLRGKTFETLKFRKFSQSSTSGGSIVTLLDDDRYSRVGRFLEKTKLNELPQLINVLMGDMSIVGPRPEILAFRHCFAEHNSKLLEFAPGIFGPSQSVFRNEAAMYPAGQDPALFYERVLFQQKAAIDLAYYPSASLTSDIHWILRSLGAVLSIHRPGSSGMTPQAGASPASPHVPARAPSQR